MKKHGKYTWLACLCVLLAAGGTIVLVSCDGFISDSDGIFRMADGIAFTHKEIPKYDEKLWRWDPNYIGTPLQPIAYRIPAITITRNGNLIAITDKRYSGEADIGGKQVIDLLARRSEDNGKTWEDEIMITDTTNGKPENRAQAYGDGSIVADRESDEVLLVCPGGTVGWGVGKQRNFVFKSSDGGKTWDNGTEVTELFHQLATYAGMTSEKGMFATSGRIEQSTQIKVGSHYRVYLAINCNGKSGVYQTVVYSDDFGTTWNRLGDQLPVKAGVGDETKTTELPDGSVLFCARTPSAGRNVNVFKYTDVASGKGFWTTNNYQYLDIGNGQRTNGGSIVIKARDAKTLKPVYLSFVSIPAGPGRKCVSIYWRKIEKDMAYYDDVKAFSGTKEDWQRYEMESDQSVYSEMIMQKDGHLGFIYEFQYGYGSWWRFDIRYKNPTIEDITGGQYTNAFLGLGTRESPYTDINGLSVPASDRDFFGNEHLHWSDGTEGYTCPESGCPCEAEWQNTKWLVDSK